MLKKQNYKKVLVLGSGGLKIGEGGEFDYSGSQCLKALKEEGVYSVLINPNIATVQTDEGMADKIYFLPITPDFVEKIIEKERPDGILLSFGGQTALNCGVALYTKGILQKYNVKILGTPIETIQDTEDRELFVKKLAQINLKTPKSIAVYSSSEAKNAAQELTYPVMIRSAYALGGQGSGVAKNETELLLKVEKSFSFSKQILIEEYLGGWKEIEYEVVRDQFDNCITVCNMENFDPLGIHTGESIVIAPSQTLNNYEYHKLRSISIQAIRHLGIIGECNIQFAFDPLSDDYRIIEVNARLSRSSALASKATGYPLAFIAAKISLGYALTELQNKITKVTYACFEPSLDYVALKMPRWDLQKFTHVSRNIGSEMKSVGEIMAIGRTFEEALQKGLRMLSIGLRGICSNELFFENVVQELSYPTDKRLLAVSQALSTGISVEEIYTLTKIDKWFLYKIRKILDCEKELQKYIIDTLPPSLLLEAKKEGFSDEQIAVCLWKNKESLNEKERIVREKRGREHIKPFIKQIDTLGAEYPAKTNYLYLTYSAVTDDISINSKEEAVLILGSGVYRIGSSVEFDWCSVNAARTLKKIGKKTIMINCNPETVSTDYDEGDRLYFEEMSFETVLEIVSKEMPKGVLVSVGGQNANNLALKLHKANVPILGTSPENIDRAEDRNKFSDLLDEQGIDQPVWTTAHSLEKTKEFAFRVSYPVLIRPSYVLSGSAMRVCSNETELQEYLEDARAISQTHPVVVSKFITDAKEIELDGVAKNGEIVISAISEHIENAGVHSGDATLVFPPQYMYLETIKRVKEVGAKIVKELQITGPFNMQFIAKNNDIKVIECNVRASRSFPFVSKITKKNFIDIAIRAIMEEDILEKYGSFDLDYVGVKAPQFSFSRLQGADPVTRIEMASTGEVACIGENTSEALLKSLLAVNMKLPTGGVLLSTGPIKNKAYLLESIKKLAELGHTLYATKGTATFLQENNISCISVAWPKESEPNALTLMKEKKISLVINIPKNYEETEITNDYLIRRCAVDQNISLITNAQITKLFIESLHKKQEKKLLRKSWDEY